MHPNQVGIDSQCLSYIIDAWSGISPPKDNLAHQRVALTRLFFYLPDTLWVTPTVSAECAEIRNIARRELHTSFIQTLFGELQVKDRASVDNRSSYLRKYHSGVNDCCIVAEGEDVGHSVLLTFDSDLIRHLSQYTTLKLIAPEDYWTSLKITPGSRPDKQPYNSNPLFSEDWWKW